MIESRNSGITVSRYFSTQFWREMRLPSCSRSIPTVLNTAAWNWKVRTHRRAVLACANILCTCTRRCGVGQCTNSPLTLALGLPCFNLECWDALLAMCILCITVTRLMQARLLFIKEKSIGTFGRICQIYYPVKA